MPSTPNPKRPKTDRELSDKIIEYANLGLPWTDFLQEVSHLLIQFFGCDAVDLWLEEAGGQVRCETAGRPEKTFHFRLIPGSPKRGGKGVLILRGDSKLEAFCRRVLHGKAVRGGPSISLNDVFWVADSLSSHPSLAVTPLRVGSRRIGLIVLKSQRKGYFLEKDMAPCGRVVQNLGMALLNQRTQAALRERIKELTCLYRIARVMERPGTPLPEVLRAVAEVLPEAWQYPEIASARIVFDEQAYRSPKFREGRHRQSADLVVGGKCRGSVEVAYPGEKPEIFEGPFLKEERNLIDTVARQIVLFVEQKEAEEEKELLQEQLRHADRLAIIGKLAAGVAHELNEPLGSILGFAQLAKKSAGLPKQAEQDLDRIVSASLHAREVIRKLMLFSRQMPPRRTRLNLNRVVKEGLYLFEARCARQGIELSLSLEPGLPDIHADSTHLTQVMTNLVVNAIQAMPGGGRLSVVTWSEADSVCLRVEDTGEGMGPEVKKQIFMPFFTTKEAGQGTGLGLAGVHGIVTAHKGSIGVESQIGKGTRFDIRLPLALHHTEEKEENEKSRQEGTDPDRR